MQGLHLHIQIMIFVICAPLLAIHSLPLTLLVACLLLLPLLAPMRVFGYNRNLPPCIDPAHFLFASAHPVALELDRLFLAATRSLVPFLQPVLVVGHRFLQH